MKLFNYLENIKAIESNIALFDTEIMGVSSDSKNIGKNWIFVCIKGNKTDGHLYCREAEKRGAALLVCEYVNEQIMKANIPYIRVENTRRVLAQMCAKHYGNPEKQLKIMAVTGTNGKTSTCALLNEIYNSAGVKSETIGTLTGNMTTPCPEDLFCTFKQMFDRGTEYVVMEASSHALALDRLYGIDFRGASFTNLTREHLDFHNSMDEYAKVKAKLFTQSKWGLFNIDSEYSDIVSSDCRGRKYTYSFRNQNSDFFGKAYTSFKTEGFEYSVVYRKKQTVVKSSLAGMYNAYNTLCAYAMAHIDGVDEDIIRKGISNIKNVSGRLEKLDLKNSSFSVYIDYAHSPDAIENVINCVRGFKGKEQRITVLFGCGGDRDKSKRKVMGQIASRLADFVIVTSDNSRSESSHEIITEIMKGIDKERPHIVIENRRQAIEYAIYNARENDIILLCGKGHENYEIDRQGKRYFSEKEIALEAYNKRFKRE